MKIALTGYGKMGHAIERFALARGHEISIRIDKDNVDDLYSEAFRCSDVAIEFTSPETAFDNVKASLEANVPVVCGSTGWLDRLDEAKRICADRNGAMLYSSNYSVGVNVLFALNRKLASIMKRFDDYDVSVTEIHHVHKKDAPSGTAITLADDIINILDRKTCWSLDENNAGALHITAKREAEVAGTHVISYESSVDTIEIMHAAKNRDGFALGAVMAAEFLQGKQGFYSMQDVLGIV
jgi:4-hydroxy-tetrahydrodipicolinate reductase